MVEFVIAILLIAVIFPGFFKGIAAVLLACAILWVISRILYFVGSRL